MEAVRTKKSYLPGRPPRSSDGINADTERAGATDDLHPAEFSNNPAEFSNNATSRRWEIGKIEKKSREKSHENAEGLIGSNVTVLPNKKEGYNNRPGSWRSYKTHSISTRGGETRMRGGDTSNRGRQVIGRANENVDRKRPQKCPRRPSFGQPQSETLMIFSVKSRSADKSISRPVKQSVRPISRPVDQSCRQMLPQHRREVQPKVATGANAIAISSANPVTLRSRTGAKTLVETNDSLDPMEVLDEDDTAKALADMEVEGSHSDKDSDNRHTGFTGAFSGRGVPPRHLRKRNAPTSPATVSQSAGSDYDPAPAGVSSPTVETDPIRTDGTELGQFLIQANIANRRVKVLVDTWASVSFIDKTLVPQLNPPPERQKSAIAVILGNSTEETTNENIAVDIVLKNHKFAATFKYVHTAHA